MTWNNGEVIAEKRRYILDDIFAVNQSIIKEHLI